MEANQESSSTISSYVFGNLSAFLLFFNQSQISTVSQSTIAPMFYFSPKGTICFPFSNQELIFMKPQNFIYQLSVTKTCFFLKVVVGSAPFVGFHVVVLGNLWFLLNVALVSICRGMYPLP